MKNQAVNILIVLLMTTLTFSYGQNVPIDSLYSISIKKYIHSYKRASQLAYNDYEFKKGQQLFNTFVTEKLKHTYLDNFKARTLRKKLITINEEFKKPTLLITYTSWCVQDESEIEAINSLANEYHDNIDFAVVFWSDYKSTKKRAKQFNKHVNVLYIDERENLFSSELKNLKHALGYQLHFFIDRNDKILNIKKNTFHSNPNISKNESYTQNYENLSRAIDPLLQRSSKKEFAIVK